MYRHTKRLTFRRNLKKRLARFWRRSFRFSNGRERLSMQALKLMKRENELKQVAERYALIKQEKAAVEADM